MAWSGAVGWWIAAAVLIAIELTIGTFYLLMLALGLVAAALVTHAGGGLAAQLVVAAVVGGGAVTALHLRRGRQRPAAPAASNVDVLLDIGSRVHVAQWRTDGTARVQYRGAGWNARFVGDGAPQPGDHVIQAMDGNELLLVV